MPLFTGIEKTETNVAYISRHALKVNLKKRRRNYVDRAVSELLEKVLDERVMKIAVRWDEEIIEDCRQALEDVLCGEHDLLSEEDFYPTINPDDTWICPDLDTPVGFVREAFKQAKEQPLTFLLVAMTMLVLMILIF